MNIGNIGNEEERKESPRIGHGDDESLILDDLVEEEKMPFEFNEGRGRNDDILSSPIPFDIPARSRSLFNTGTYRHSFTF